jgi:hypothetical protein
LENIEIPILGVIPKIPKLFDFGLILADYGSFQHLIQLLAIFRSLDRFWQILTVYNRFRQIMVDSPAFGYG